MKRSLARDELRHRLHTAIAAETAAIPNADHRTLDRELAKIMEATAAGDRQSPAARERLPWRLIGSVGVSLGTLVVGIGMPRPLFGVAIAAAEIIVALTIFATALFGSQALSDRSFRLLRWFGNRPEPPTPDAQQSTGSQDRPAPMKNLRSG
jgi:hypothetical protein